MTQIAPKFITYYDVISKVLILTKLYLKISVKFLTENACE